MIFINVVKYLGQRKCQFTSRIERGKFVIFLVDFKREFIVDLKI